MTFGKTTTGPNNSGGNDWKWASKYTMGPTNGLAQSIHCYFATKAGVTTEIKMGIYEDNAGVPGARVAQVTVGFIATPSWQVGTLANEALLANTPYHLSYTVDSDPAWATNYGWAVGVANFRAKVRVYANEMTDPWGAVANTYDRDLSIFVTYKPVVARRLLLGVGL